MLWAHEDPQEREKCINFMKDGDISGEVVPQKLADVPTPRTSKCLPSPPASPVSAILRRLGQTPSLYLKGVKCGFDDLTIPKITKKLRALKSQEEREAFLHILKRGIRPGETLPKELEYLRASPTGKRLRRSPRLTSALSIHVKFAQTKHARQELSPPGIFKKRRTMRGNKQEDAK
jgi:hypothetical protein